MIGSTFGHYRILDKIGQGGMGEVFLAEDTSLHRRVALKFLTSELELDAAAHKRLLREARSAAALDHPYICHINEVGEWDGRSFFAMEYVEGHSLKERLAERSLEEADVLRIASEVAEALEAAHAKGIIHRDIKPGNIMLTPSGHAKVMDFGVAKQLIPSGVGGTGEGGHTALTSEGAPVGTLAYMSPEQLCGQEADARSDVWALGATLFEMVAGGLPFPGRSWFEVSDAVLNEAPRPLPPQVSGDLGAVIQRCLEKDPSRRYQEVAELRRALEAVQAGTLPPWTAWRYQLARRRWIAPGMVLAVISAVVLGLDWGGLRGRITGNPAGAGDAIRLAVLPFANRTGDPEKEHLSDGFTEEMTTQLGVLHPERLVVKGNVSVMRFKNTGTTLDQIGRELGVDLVLSGSFRQEADSVRVIVELVRVQGQELLWGKAFDRERSGINFLQADVARGVAEALALTLLPTEEARLANVRSVNPAAHEAYQKGTQARLALTDGGLVTAERYFNLALEIDSSYAAAYAGIARVWMARQQMGIVPPAYAFREARTAINQALALDETEWEAHRALASIQTFGDWDWPAAELEWNRLLEINRNDGEALAGYSHFLMIMGRSEEALENAERAIELDPLNVKTLSFYVATLAFVGQYDRAIAAARETMFLQPDAPVARNSLYQALFQTGRYEEALALDREDVANDPEVRAALEAGYRGGGYPGAQRRLAEALAGRVGNPGGPPAISVSLRYLYAGDHDQSVFWLERAFQDGGGWIPYLVGPLHEPLRSDPRFQELIRRLGLPG
jgi:serine/threonine-protein kinase